MRVRTGTHIYFLRGYISFPFGKLFEKGLSLGTGQCNVKVCSTVSLAGMYLIACISQSYNRYLRKSIYVLSNYIFCRIKFDYVGDLIISGRAKPSFVVSHNLSLDQAPAAYEKFDKRIDGYTKVLLHP